MLFDPSLKEAHEKLARAISEQETTILVANCTVDYRGRASSRLDLGERIIILKQDGCVLVHRPAEYQPVNWQPSGCILQAQLQDDKLIVHSRRNKPREHLQIHIDQIRLLYTGRLQDKGEFAMFLSELDMQKAIRAQPNLVEPGLKLVDYEKRVEPGFIDVYAADEKGRMVVIEIKREKADRNAVQQLARYVQAVRKRTGAQLRAIVVAPTRTRDSIKLAQTMDIEFKPVKPQACLEVLRSLGTAKQDTLREWF